MAGFVQKVKKSSIYTLIGRTWDQVVGLIITWLLIKVLSVEEYGIYNLLVGTGVFLGIVSSFGLIPALQRYLPEFFQRKEYLQFWWTVRLGLIVRGVGAILSVSVIALLFDKIGPFFQIGDYFKYFLTFSIGVIFLFQAHLLQGVLRAMFLHQYAVRAEIIYSLIRLLLLCVVFYLGYGLLEVFVTNVIASVILLGLCFRYYRLNADQTMGEGKQSETFSRSSLFKRLFRYSGFSVFNQIGKGILDISTDLFVIAHFLGSSPLGYYSFAARIGRLISSWLPSKILRQVVTPTLFARYGESRDKKEIDRMFGFLSKLNAFLMFPVFAFAAVFGKEIIQYVFDPKYLTAYPVMLILLIHFMMRAFPVALPLQAVEKPEMVLIGKLSSVYNLVMDIVLIQFWGIAGVAIATASAIFLKKVFEYAMSRKYAGITFPWVGISKILLNCLIVGGLAMVAKQFVNDLFSLGVVCSLGAVAYLGISYFNKSFLEEESDLINKIIGKPYFVF